MTEQNKEDTNDPNQCIWKPPIKQKINGQVKELKFPCRYPEKEKTNEVCSPCLMGDLFAINYTQMMNMKQQQAMSDEIMTYLRNMTSDGTSLDDLK